MMYEGGKGVPQDQAEAMAWYRRAAEQGYARSQFAWRCATTAARA
jgi:TPR repeat protein